MIAYPDIPGIIIHPIAPADRANLHCAILPEPAPTPVESAAIDHAWSELCRANPRLHDGPILIASRATGLRATGSPPRATGSPSLRRQPVHVATSPQHTTNSPPNTTPSASEGSLPTPHFTLSAHRSTYKTLATAPILNPSIRALGVQALLFARDAAGDEHILLGRRGSEVRMYPGLWENAPSGTVSPPPAATTSIGLSHFVAALIAEGVEELGLDLTTARTTCIALLDDSTAHSLDAVLRLELPTPINPLATTCAANDAHRWEYAATAWVPTSQLAAWVAAHPHAISPPMQALVQWMCRS